MVTITPKYASHVSITATLQTPFHHGAGNAGNTSLLRTQEVMDPKTGTISKVPFLSAASVRHGIREALAWHLIEHAGIEDGSLSKAAVDLLFSGGAVTSTGAKTNLDMARRVEQDLPMLSLLGYAAQSDIVSGTLRASELMLVCVENNWRCPIKDQHRAAKYRSEEFGTRKDTGTTPAQRMIQMTKGDLGTAQMIFDQQILIPGARLWGMVGVSQAATKAQIQVMQAGLELWAPGGEARLGAKTAQGFGVALIDGIDQLEAQRSCNEWTKHVVENAGEIRQLITDLAS